MPNYSKHDIVLVRYPFSDQSDSKIRPAVVISAPHVSQDIFIVPLTSKTTSLMAGEYVLANWKNSGLNVPSAVKRGMYTVHETLIIKKVGKLSVPDTASLETALRDWLDLH
jgi:mRNA interferase MazF